jgi:two-component system response regulator WspF
VVWVARDGERAIAKRASDPPDLILMTLDLPDLDGVEAVRRLMTPNPIAILAITEDLSRDRARIFEAMGYGLRDVVDIGTNSEYRHDTLDKIATIARLIGAPINRAITPPIVIGASTGGPVALATILSALPEDFNAAIAIVQHLKPEFLPGLVTWLDRQTPLPVAIAGEGDHLEPGKVLVANTGNHLRLGEDWRLTYTKNPTDHLYRPSIDVFFESVTRRDSLRGIGILLTGMGDDGAAGLARLRQKGWHTIAQSRRTCVVYGMPKAAVALDAATEILDLESIAPALLLLQKRFSF